MAEKKNNPWLAVAMLALAAIVVLIFVAQQLEQPQAPPKIEVEPDPGTHLPPVSLMEMAKLRRDLELRGIITKEGKLNPYVFPGDFPDDCVQLARELGQKVLDGTANEADAKAIRVLNSEPRIARLERKKIAKGSLSREEELELGFLSKHPNKPYRVCLLLKEELGTLSDREKRHLEWLKKPARFEPHVSEPGKETKLGGTPIEVSAWFIDQEPVLEQAVQDFRAGRMKVESRRIEIRKFIFGPFERLGVNYVYDAEGRIYASRPESRGGIIADPLTFFRPGETIDATIAIPGSVPELPLLLDAKK